jgi:hypothetical protein
MSYPGLPIVRTGRMEKLMIEIPTNNESDDEIIKCYIVARSAKASEE